jgi:hypothetical protein
MESIQGIENYGNAVISSEIGSTFIKFFAHTNGRIDIEILESTVKAAEHFLALASKVFRISELFSFSSFSILFKNINQTTRGIN